MGFFFFWFCKNFKEHLFLFNTSGGCFFQNKHLSAKLDILAMGIALGIHIVGIVIDNITRSILLAHIWHIHLVFLPSTLSKYLLARIVLQYHLTEIKKFLCRYENLPIPSSSHKNDMPKDSHYNTSNFWGITHWRLWSSLYEKNHSTQVRCFTWVIFR